MKTPPIQFSTIQDIATLATQRAPHSFYAKTRYSLVKTIDWGKKIDREDYYLSETSAGYHAERFILTKELYDILDSVWTKKPAHYNNGLQNTGARTLIGIVKLLEKNKITPATEKGISEQVKQAKQIEAERIETRKRNSERSTLRTAISQLEKAIEDADDLRIKYTTFPKSLHESNGVLDWVIGFIGNPDEPDVNN